MIPIKNFIKKNLEAALIFLALIFLVVIAGFFYGTVNVVVEESEKAIGTSLVQTGPAFDLQDAARIDFRGLMGSGSTTPPASSSGGL